MSESRPGLPRLGWSRRYSAASLTLAAISKAAVRSADITRQLLAFDRKQIVVPKILDLNDTVEGMCFIEKPFSQKELVAKIREALESKEGKLLDTRRR